MSGYKRVSFYELCRLCASNQQKEKTHIFQEEGRKIQLQTKIQTCFSLPVCENDFLPKVVCSKCLRSLEVCFNFRQQCVTSESMLSTYFKNFRYTEDFKKSGKVYIKDTTSKSVSASPEHNELSTLNSSNVTDNRSNLNHNNQAVEQLPLFTLQLPTIVSNPNVSSSKNTIKNELVDNKIMHNTPIQPQVAYNFNTINLAAIKSSLSNMPKSNTSEMMSNVVVNANGEVINIAQLVDFESIVNHSNLHKNKTQKPTKKAKDHKICDVPEDNIIKIDLTDSDNTNEFDTGQTQVKYEKLPHIKTTPNNKYACSVKVDEKTTNPTVIFNPMSEFNNQNTSSYNNFSTNNTLYSQSNINLVNPTSTNSLATNSSIICNTQNHLDQPTVNLSMLNQNIQDMTSQNNFSRNFSQGNFTNISAVASNLVQNSNSVTTADSTSKIMSTNPNIVINSVHSSNIPESSISSSSNNAANPSQSNQNNPSPNQPKSHICDFCHKSFKRREHLYQHVKLHTGFRPYVCESCNKAFMRKEHLLRHMTLHSGQKNYTCNICEKSFSRNDNLLKHKKTHDKQTSYTCEICQKQFVMKHYYIAHKVSHGDKCHVAPVGSGVWNLLKT